LNPGWAGRIMLDCRGCVLELTIDGIQALDSFA
jgi:hypothetical protein